MLKKFREFNPFIEVLWIARRKTLKTFVSITSKNSASGQFQCGPNCIQEFGFMAGGLSHWQDYNNVQSSAKVWGEKGNYVYCFLNKNY
jgi:hypothetical protein